MVYRCALRLYPHDFQTRFADELQDDFRSMSLDAWSHGGSRSLIQWWGDATLDAASALWHEWLRTPWLPISIVSAAIAAGVFWATIGRAQLPLRAFRQKVLSNAPPPPDSPALLLLMGMMVLIPVAAVLLIWGLLRLIRHESPPRRTRA